MNRRNNPLLLILVWSVLAFVGCSNGKVSSDPDATSPEAAPQDATADADAACPDLPPYQQCPPALSECCTGAQGGCSISGPGAANMGAFCPAGRWCFHNPEAPPADKSVCPPTMPEQGTPCSLPDYSGCAYHCPNNTLKGATCNSGLWCGGPAAPECVGSVPDGPHDGGPAQDADAAGD